MPSRCCRCRISTAISAWTIFASRWPMKSPTLLTYSRTLDVRPSAVTRKYVNADLDPQQVGRELHVATVLTGHFQKQGNHLLVTLEAIETGTERLVWQTNLTRLDAGPDRHAAAAGQAGPSRIAAHAGRGRRLPGNQHPAQQSGSLRSLFAQRGRCLTMPLPIGKQSSRWNTRSNWIPTTPRPGRKWASAITTTPPTRMAASRCSSTRTLRWSAPWLWIRT